MVTLSYPSKIPSRIPVINVILIPGHTVLFSVILQQEFLVRDTHALILAAVIKGNPAIEGGYLLI